MQILILVKSGELLQRGWCKYTLVDDDGNRCAAGAIFDARRELGAGYGESDVAFAKLATVVRRDFSDRLNREDFTPVDSPNYGDTGFRGILDDWGVVTTFNNHPRTTKEEVLDVFERATND